MLLCGEGRGEEVELKKCKNTTVDHPIGTKAATTSDSVFNSYQESEEDIFRKKPHQCRFPKSYYLCYAVNYLIFSRQYLTNLDRNGSKKTQTTIIRRIDLV